MHLGAKWSKKYKAGGNLCVHVQKSALSVEKTADPPRSAHETITFPLLVYHVEREK